MRLHHKLIIIFSMVSLAVLVTGAGGLFVISEIGGDIGAVLEEKVAVADASSEIVSTIASSQPLLHEYAISNDLDRMNQIEKEMENYHKIDDMWMHAIIYGTESREFIESEEYSFWLEYGYGAKGIIIRKADPEVIPIIEELDVHHKKFHEAAKRMMKLRKEEVVIHQNITDLYSKEKSSRYGMRDIILAQGDYLVMADMGKVEYAGKEALFQYRDKKHADEWIEAIETLQTDIANSTFTPGIKSEIQNYSAEYLSLAKTLSGNVLKLNELDVEIHAQMDVLRGHITDIDANVVDIKAISFAARVDAKREIEEYIAYMFTLMAVVMVVVITLILSIGYLTNKFISQPIIKLRDATRKTGEGDFGVRVDIKSWDEIGELGTAFNEMAEALKKRTSERAEHAEQLEEKVQELERFRKLAVGRELKMIELKERIKELEEKINIREKVEKEE